MKKIPPKSMTHSSCKKSLDWLREYAKEWLAANVPDCGEIWLPDDNHFALTSDFPQEDTQTEIIFTGSFLLRLVELPYWKLKKVRVWTFSSAVKKLLVHYLKLDPKMIGLIPHLKNLQQKLNLQDAELIYVGRLNWTKNIEALLYLTSYLQHHYSEEITLKLVGSPDDLPDESLGRVDAPAFSKSLEKMINQLPWVTPPVLSGYHQYWEKLLGPKSHFISLSTSMYEDFGVAANLAGKGIPCLLSSWGGHWEQAGAHLLPSEHIFHSFEPEWIKKAKTNLLAKDLLEGKLKTPHQRLALIPPILPFEDLQKASLDFINHYSPEILLLFRDDLDTFADTEKGKTLFHQYRNEFAGHVPYRKLHLYGEEAQDYPLSEETLVLSEQELIYSINRKYLFQEMALEVNGVSPKLYDFLTQTLQRTDLKKC